jgi:hypothetical protein
MFVLYSTKARDTNVKLAVSNIKCSVKYYYGNKSRRMKWRALCHSWHMRNTCRILVGIPERNRPFGRPRSRGEDNIKIILGNIKSRDSPVGIALGYGLDDRGSRVRFPAGAGNFSLHHRVQNESGAYPASYPMSTRDSFPGGKAAWA